MELRQIEYLLAVLDEGSFTKAASRLKIAQSAVSHQIAKLETELDVTLLRRERPIVTPTPAGEVFVARMRRVVAEIGAAKGEAASLHGRTVGEVNFGATFPAASLDVPEILAGFRAGYPDVRLKLREGTTIELFEMLRTDVIDTALITTELKHLPTISTWWVPPGIICRSCPSFRSRRWRDWI
jgi:LysR family transcriptional activator of glutamate synthase operon